MLGGTIVLAMLAWVVSARKWFKVRVGRGGCVGCRVAAVGLPSSGPSCHACKPQQARPALCMPLCSHTSPAPTPTHPPTHPPQGPVRNVDVGNKTETLAEAAMRGELDEDGGSSADGGEAGTTKASKASEADEAPAATAPQFLAGTL